MTTDTTIPSESIERSTNFSGELSNQASKIIRKYTLISGGTALVPIDFVDVVSSTAAQAMMVKELCDLYDVPYTDKMTTVAVWSAAGSIITKAITGVVSSIINQNRPGSSIDFSGAAVAGIYTAAVGEFYNLHLKEGGTLDTIEVSAFVDYFIDEIKKGDISMSTFTNPQSLINHLNI